MGQMSEDQFYSEELPKRKFSDNSNMENIFFSHPTKFSLLYSG